MALTRTALYPENSKDSPSLQTGPSTDCIQSWSALTDIDTEVGLTPDSYSNILAAHQGVLDGEITADTASETTCLGDLSTASCFGSGVEQAYDTTLPNPYINGAGMIPASCAAVF